MAHRAAAVAAWTHPGIPLALDDPQITTDGAVADVLSALEALLRP